jgi:pilus assembly protein CpaE
VIDLPRSMVIAYPHLLQAVNVVVVVCEFTLASARDSIRVLAWLKSNAPHCQTIVVANKVQPGAMEISRKDFEGSIERKIDLTMPFDIKATGQAAKLGKPVAEAVRSSKVSAAISALADMTKNVAPTVEEPSKVDKSNAKKKSLMTNFTSLLTKKSK